MLPFYFFHVLYRGSPRLIVERSQFNTFFLREALYSLSSSFCLDYNTTLLQPTAAITFYCPSVYDGYRSSPKSSKSYMPRQNVNRKAQKVPKTQCFLNKIEVFIVFCVRLFCFMRKLCEKAQKEQKRDRLTEGTRKGQKEQEKRGRGMWHRYTMTTVCHVASLPLSLPPMCRAVRARKTCANCLPHLTRCACCCCLPWRFTTFSKCGDRNLR